MYSRIKAEEDLSRSEIRIQEILSEKDNTIKECHDIRLQLQMAEDKSDNLNGQLNDTLRKLKESLYNLSSQQFRIVIFESTHNVFCFSDENEAENIRKELIDARRQLSNSNVERDKYNSTNKELRDQVKRSEQERREHARSLEEAFHKIAGIY